MGNPKAGQPAGSTGSDIDLGAKPDSKDRSAVRRVGPAPQKAPGANGSAAGSLDGGNPSGNGHATNGRPTRGRPPKPAQQQTPGSLVVEEKSKPFPKPPPVQKLTEKERETKAAEAGKTLLQFTSGAAATLLGPEAAMQKHEMAAIEGPLERLMMRLPPAILENVSEWTDPLALCIALFFWLQRVAGIARARAAAREAEQSAGQPERKPGDAPEKPAVASIEGAMPVAADGSLKLRGLTRKEMAGDGDNLP